MFGSTNRYALSQFVLFLLRYQIRIKFLVLMVTVIYVVEVSCF